MQQRFERYIREQHLFPPWMTVLLAVSGGRDSVCMAHLMHHSGIPFAIAHCNFHLRPGDCDRDQRFVADLAASFGVPFHTVDVDTRAYAADRSMSIEEAARHLRYSWFARLCDEHCYSCVATAHHSDDSIETFFLNLFRGTGLSGLHGILPLSTLIYHGYQLVVARPMLCFSRADIDAYVEGNGLAYVEDSTNADLDAQRNRIRHQLMPLLRTLYPSVDATMLRNISHLRDAGLLLESYISSSRAELVKPAGLRVPVPGLHVEAIDLDALRAQLTAHGSQLTTLFELLRPYGFNAAQTGEMLAAVDAPHTGSRWLSATHTAVIDRGRLLLALRCDPVLPTVSVRAVAAVDLDAVGLGSTRIFVDADAFRQPYLIRPWAEGDRFCPFGMGGRMRLVSDVLKDMKLSVVEKEHVCVLCDADDRIVWLVGLRADDRFRVRPETRNVLEVTLIPA